MKGTRSTHSLRAGCASRHPGPDPFIERKTGCPSCARVHGIQDADFPRKANRRASGCVVRTDTGCGFACAEGFHSWPCCHFPYAYCCPCRHDLRHGLRRWRGWRQAKPGKELSCTSLDSRRKCVELPPSASGAAACASPCSGSRPGASCFPPVLLMTMFVARAIRQTGGAGRRLRAVTALSRRMQVALHCLIGQAAVGGGGEQVLWQRQIERTGLAKRRIFRAGVGPPWQRQGQSRRQQDQIESLHERVLG
jgi:hypothetical protein